SARDGGHGPGRPVHHSRPRRRPGDERDSLSVREPDPGDRLPHRAPESRGRVPEADRPLDSRLMNMLGLLKLTWLEIKIFMREPLGAIGTIAVPVLMFVVIGRVLGRRAVTASSRFSALIGVRSEEHTSELQS